MEYTIEEIKQAFKEIFDYCEGSFLTEKEWIVFKDRLKNISDNKENWKKDFQEYRKLVFNAKKTILSDRDLCEKRIYRFWPNLDIMKSLELSIDRFWGTEDGWKLKIKQSKKVKKLNMVETLIKNIGKNKIFLPYGHPNRIEEVQQPVKSKMVTPEVEI